MAEADVELDIDVRFGISRRAITKTDTGTSRSSADVLTIRGVGAGHRVSSAIRLLLLYQRGLPGSVREFVSNDEVARAFDGWHDIEDVVRTVNGHAFPESVKSAPLYAEAFLASRSPQRAKLAASLDALPTGPDVSKDNAAYLLRERLMRATDAPVGSRELLVERFAQMVKSWNLLSKSGSIAKRDFRWSPAGRNAEPFPKVNGTKALGLGITGRTVGPIACRPLRDRLIPVPAASSSARPERLLPSPKTSFACASMASDGNDC